MLLVSGIEPEHVCKCDQTSRMFVLMNHQWRFPKSWGSPKSSILMGFSCFSHDFPWHKPASYWVYPPWLWKPRFHCSTEGFLCCLGPEPILAPTDREPSTSMSWMTWASKRWSSQNHLKRSRFSSKTHGTDATAITATAKFSLPSCFLDKPDTLEGESDTIFTVSFLKSLLSIGLSTTPSKGYKHWMVVPTAPPKRIKKLQESGEH